MPLSSMSKRDGDGIADQLLAQLSSAKRKVAEERTLPVTPLTYTDPFFLVMQCVSQREDLDTKNESQKFQTRSTFIGHEAHFSSTPLQDLRPILLRDMKVRQREIGRYLLCRVIAPPYRVVATTLAVEDPEGWGQLLSLYNFRGTYSAAGQELDMIFPINSVVAIREPLTKMALLASHSHIRIDSPTDLIILEPSNAILANVKWVTGVRPMPAFSKTAEEWKAAGDKHFKSKQYYASIAAYSFALFRKPLFLNALLNRSLANLRVERNLVAIEDVQVVLTSNDLPASDRTKALYRYAQAVYAQGDYMSAKEWYSKCLATDKTLKEAAAGIERCGARIKEQTLGTYDWCALHEWDTGPYTPADVADYIGPVKKATMGHRGGGRGVVATQDISAGELLVCAKPFASATRQNFKAEDTLIGMNFFTNELQDQSRYIVIQRTIERMMSSPRDTADVLDLYGGPNYSNQHTSQQWSAETQNTNPIDIDSTRVQAICTLNAFGGAYDGTETPKLTMSDSRLYTFPSYFNHSCLSNAERNMIGDVVVIRAARNITAGEEVTISYCGHGASYEQRTKMLKTWFSECDCSLCEQDRLEGESNRLARDKIVKGVESRDHDIPKLRILAKEIDNSYKAGYGWYRPSTSVVHRALGDALEREFIRLNKAGRTDKYVLKFLKESIQEQFIALEAEGVVIVNKNLDAASTSSKTPGLLPISTHSLPYHAIFCVGMCFNIVGGFGRLKNRTGAEMWMRAALWIDNAWMGGGVKLFKIRHAQNLALMEELGEKLLASVEGSV